MSMRAAANQFGYLLGAAAGGLAITVAGFPGLGITLASMFLAAALIHAPWPRATPARVAPQAAGSTSIARAGARARVALVSPCPAT